MAAEGQTILFAIVLNIASAIGIVFLNKTIYLHTDFPNITLTLVHFVVTSIGIHLCACFNVFSPKQLQIKKVLPLSIAFCGFVVLTNLSLQHNTVGTYQVAKVMTTPVILFVQTYFYRNSTPWVIQLSTLPVILGVVVDFFYDVQFNVLGTVFASTGVLVTAVYQIWVGTTQSSFSVNSMQLLYYQAPISAAILAVVAPLFEPTFSTVLQLDLYTAGMVLLSGCVAFCVNLSIFWIIGNTSPLTYNMVGHSKFCITLLGGMFWFRDPVSINQMFGIGLVVAGISLYTYLKVKQQNEKQAAEMAAREAKPNQSI